MWSWASLLTSLCLNFSIYFRGLLRESMRHCLLSSQHSIKALKMLLLTAINISNSITKPTVWMAYVRHPTYERCTFPSVRKLFPLIPVCLYWSGHTASSWCPASNKEGLKASFVLQCKVTNRPVRQFHLQLSLAATCPNNWATGHNWLEALNLMVPHWQRTFPANLAQEKLQNIS